MDKTREQIKRTGDAILLAQYDAGKITDWPPAPPLPPSKPATALWKYIDDDVYIPVLVSGMMIATLVILFIAFLAR